MKARIKRELLRALKRAQDLGRLPTVDVDEQFFTLEEPRQAAHGDLATNMAMQLARVMRTAPREIAQAVVEELGNGGGLFTKVEIAGPGFINFFITPEAWMEVLPRIMREGPDYGRGDWGGGKKVLVEFVSANPTGPLHVGHGRGAAVGDVLVRLMRFSGFDVTSEYYINDAGRQMQVLGRSVLLRARELMGEEVSLPEDHYQGGYIIELARELLDSQWGKGLIQRGEEGIEEIAQWAAGRIMEQIKDDLKAFRVEFDSFQSEKALRAKGEVEKALGELAGRGFIYDAEGAVWFRSSNFGDEKDRVVRRSNGELTYFATDIAYHHQKFLRGYEELVDIWGADHHGYVPRLKAAMQALGHDPQQLKVMLVQMVSLVRGGEPVAMSTRAGQFVTLREVVEEVGADAARFIFLTRRCDAQLEFDLALAREKSMDNPVYYVQYAHTRVASVMRKATQRGLSPRVEAFVASALGEKDELALAKSLSRFPEEVHEAAANLEPHRVCYYLQELAGQFHSYYNATRILVDDPVVANARLVLAAAVGQVLRTGLELMGVEAPESM